MVYVAAATLLSSRGLALPGIDISGDGVGEKLRRNTRSRLDVISNYVDTAKRGTYLRSPTLPFPHRRVRQLTGRAGILRNDNAAALASGDIARCCQGHSATRWQAEAEVVGRGKVEGGRASGDSHSVRRRGVAGGQHVYGANRFKAVGGQVRLN